MYIVIIEVEVLNEYAQWVENLIKFAIWYYLFFIRTDSIYPRV
jgi:hypothetical protein